MKELNECVRITENDKSKVIAIFKRLVNSGLAGDLSALKLVVSWMQKSMPLDNEDQIPLIPAEWLQSVAAKLMQKKLRKEGHLNKLVDGESFVSAHQNCTYGGQRTPVVRKNSRHSGSASDDTVFVVKSVQDWASDD
jgi:hypothetical protein